MHVKFSLIETLNRVFIIFFLKCFLETTNVATYKDRLVEAKLLPPTGMST